MSDVMSVDVVVADVIVVGGGVAGLVCARDLALAGRQVTLLEATDRLGGCVTSHTVAGLRLDAGAESFATRSPAVRALIDELGLGDGVVVPAGTGAWVRLAERSVPLPRAGIVGIPSDVWSREVRAAICVAGALRASLDRVLPAWVGTRGRTTTLAHLVRARMGRRVLTRLVAPVVGGIHSAYPAALDPDAVAPGILDAVRSTGSLSGAVRLLRARTASGSGTSPSGMPARSGAPAQPVTPVRPGAAVAGIDGGMHRLVTALADDVARLGVRVRLGQGAQAIDRVADGWAVRLADGAWAHCSDVVLAVPGPVAHRLLDPAAPALAPGPVVTLVTLVLDAPSLDAAPRGTGVLVSREAAAAAGRRIGRRAGRRVGRGPVRAKALTHATAKWAWLAREAGPGRHVVRLSYGRLSDGRLSNRTGGDGAGVAAMSDDDLTRIALADASMLLGTALSADLLVGFARVVWDGVVPRGSGRQASVDGTGGTGHVAASLRVRAESAPRRWVCGAWVAGQGLAAVVADARTTAARVVVGRAAGEDLTRGQHKMTS